MNRAFQALQRQWYKRLAKSGFRDIETQPIGPAPSLMDRATPRRHDAVLWHSHAEFYRRAGVLAENWPRRWPRKHRTIWRHHADGATMREIAAAVGLSTMRIQQIVSRYSAILATMDLDALEGWAGDAIQQQMVR